jgi:hypothetical protein
MDAIDILTLSGTLIFARFFPSSFPSVITTRIMSFMIIVNTYTDHQPGSHWVAIHLDTRSSNGYYYQSYVIVPALRAICKGPAPLELQHAHLERLNDQLLPTVGMPVHGLVEG